MANVTNVSQSVIDGLLRERQDKLDADRMAKALWMKSEEALKEFAKNYSINESFLKYILELLNIFKKNLLRAFISFWSLIFAKILTVCLQTHVLYPIMHLLL